MEKTSIVIEIKQEVAIMLGWLVVGVMIVKGGFLFGSGGKDLWSALNTAGVCAGLYLVALIGYSLRKPLPVKSRITMGVFSALMLVAIASTWNGQYKQSHWQRETLLNIREVIGRGILAYEIPNLLLKTLDGYYQQGGKKSESLGEVFQRLNPRAIVGANIQKDDVGYRQQKIFVQAITNREVILIGQETVAKGKNPQFKNYDESMGMMQEKFILTEKGIVHESQN
ncbi:MAG: hypothetical protein HY276_05855 [Ignavibacteriales bacterium]|nr:hypothetical protein [Ignavibacteriales bacterium]